MRRIYRGVVGVWEELRCGHRVLLDGGTSRKPYRVTVHTKRLCSECAKPPRPPEPLTREKVERAIATLRELLDDLPRSQ